MSHLPRLRWIAMAVVITALGGARAQDVSGGGFYPIRGSARTIGLAGAFTAVSDDVAGLQFNPAGMAQLTTRQGGASIEVNDGEDYFNISYIEPVESGKFGGGLMYTTASVAGRDDDVYQFTYGQYWAPGLAAGASFRYHTVDVGAASDEQFSFDFGLLYQPTTLPEWSFGLTVLDINEPSFSGIGLSKRVFNAGAAYRPDEYTTIALDWYDIGSAAKRGQIRLGAERLLSENIGVRAGFTEDVFGVGVSLRYRYLTLDYGFQRIDNGPDINMISVLGNF